MLRWSRCGFVMCLFCLGWSGCSPTVESQADEQNNPHYQAGKERLTALDYKGAIESFERAIEDNPRSALAHYELGVLFDQHENDYVEALYHYNKALKLRPSGYPSENIRQRIPACKQELIKADSLAIINPTALRETERLREENQTLRRQVETLQAYIANRPFPAPPAALPVSAGYGSAAGTLPSPGGTNAVSGRPAAGGSSSGSDRLRAMAAANGKPRTHTVKAGETPAAIARQYQLKLPALLAANPGLEPRRLRVGQVLNLPAS